MQEDIDAEIRGMIKMIKLNKLEKLPPITAAKTALLDAGALAYVAAPTQADMRKILNRVFAHVGYALGRLCEAERQAEAEAEPQAVKAE